MNRKNLLFICVCMIGISPLLGQRVSVIKQYEAFKVSKKQKEFAPAVIVKIANGLSVSSINTDEQFDLLDEKRYDYSGFVGINYFYHQYFFLSSEIGYASKGGKKTVELTDIHGNPSYYFMPNEQVNYLHFNTTVRIKYPAKQYYFYAGIGPKIDFLLSNDRLFFDSENIPLIPIHKNNPATQPYRVHTRSVSDNRENFAFENYTLKRVLFGFKPEIGFDYCFAKKFMLGISASYHINMGNTGKCNFLNESDELRQRNLYGKTFLFMLNCGYTL